MEDIAALKQRLVQASLILNQEGLTQAFGHISVRIPGTDKFLIPGHISPALVRFEDILTMNLKNEKLEGSREPNSETWIHTCIYRLRPDVNSVSHTHSRRVVTLSATGQLLKPLDYGHLPFASGVPLYTELGLIDTEEAGDEIAKMLGSHTAIMLRGHGAVIVSADLRQAVLFSMRLEDAADKQIWATLLGTPMFITEEEISNFKKKRGGSMGTGKQIQRAWDYYVSKLTPSQ